MVTKERRERGWWENDWRALEFEKPLRVNGHNLMSYRTPDLCDMLVLDEGAEQGNLNARDQARLAWFQQRWENNGTVTPDMPPFPPGTPDWVESLYERVKAKPRAEGQPRNGRPRRTTALPELHHDQAQVYFVQAGDDGPIKIGTSTNVRARLEALTTMSPLPLTFLGMIPGNATKERELHLRFADARKHGEWFEPTVELLVFIAEATA